MLAQVSKTILVVDDEPEIRTALSHYLSSEGFSVSVAADGLEMTEIIEENEIDLILLDLGLKDESGLDLMKNVISETNVAVVILTGKSDPIERVVGLELGADDYIVKPFLQRELLARINAVLRRTNSQNGNFEKKTEAKSRKICINDWLIDTQMRQVQTKDGARIDLTGAEFDMLAALVKNVGQTMSRDQLSWTALNREWVPSDRSVDIHIHNLRRKLSCNSDYNDDAIVAIRNIGYVLAAEVQTA